MKPYVIAEIGCNHKGELETAKQMIKVLAGLCQVDAVKFQKRCTRELLSEAEYNAPHPNPQNSYGKTYGEHRDFLEFNLDQHKNLKDFCQENGVVYSTSVWDLTSTKEVIELSPEFIKVPSACNLNKALLLELINSYQGEIHVSLGMTTIEEEEKIVELFKTNGRAKDLVIYACTSGYPVQMNEVYLNEIPRLIKKYQGTVKHIGFSGHHLGIAIDVAALTLGSTYFERHFTLDRTWKGTDHAASLEPEGMRKLVRDLKAVSAALQEKPTTMIATETQTRDKLKKSQIRW